MVSNIDSSVSSDDLLQVLTAYGDVKEVIILSKKKFFVKIRNPYL